MFYPQDRVWESSSQLVNLTTLFNLMVQVRVFGALKFTCGGRLLIWNLEKKFSPVGIRESSSQGVHLTIISILFVWIEIFYMFYLLKEAVKVTPRRWTGPNFKFYWWRERCTSYENTAKRIFVIFELFYPLEGVYESSPNGCTSAFFPLYEWRWFQKQKLEHAFRNLKNLSFRDEMDGLESVRQSIRVSFNLLYNLMQYRSCICLYLCRYSKVVTSIIMGIKIYCQFGEWGMTFKITNF